MPPLSERSERNLLLLIAAVQFVNILDFMMVMPLGPDFAVDLGIPTARLGLIGGSYTASAAVAGIVGARFLDRFDRRSALAVSMAGLVVATALGGFAWDFPSLLAARVLAGAFGGPATSVSMAVVADVVPPARRGQAMGLVAGAFAIASVLGVPAGLELARLGNWRTPFWSVAALGVLVVGGALWKLPSLRGHLTEEKSTTTSWELVRRPEVLLALAISGLLTAGNFVIIPNISTFLQYNASYPRENLGGLYMVGGLTSLLVLRLAGRGVDRLGTVPLFAVGSLLVAAVLGLGFVPELPLVPVVSIFVVFMGAQSVRNVSLQALLSKVPQQNERARFQSMNSALQHVGSAGGAMFGASLLTETEGHHLVGMPRLALLSLAASLILPAMVYALVQRVDNPR